ncbi:MAG: ATP-grasp domain-containing protein [Candidatus Omnitrophota bacterium]
MKKIIGLTYDAKDEWQPQEGDPKDLNAEFDPAHAIDQIVGALESNGYEVKKIGNVHSLLRQIDHLGVDIVFNIAEGRHGRNRESQVPMLLEMKNIPFVGSDALTLGLTLDKLMTKKLFMAEGIPTPRFFEAKSADDLKELNHIGFPLFVKTRHEGSSKGINQQSRVNNDEEFKCQVDFVEQTYHQPALVEEFIRGTEFTVAVLGNEDPQAMPVVQYKIDGSLDLNEKIYTFAHIFNNQVEYVCPAPISEDLAKKLQEIALKVYKLVDCRDLGRVDFRVDDQGHPYVLEINPLPCLSKDDTFFYIAQVLGISYEEIIGRVLNYGLERYGLNNGKLLNEAATYGVRH